MARLLPAEIVLLYVYDPPAGIRTLFGASYDEKIMNKLKEKLAGLSSRVQAETGLHVSTLMETGRIYSKILETAGKIQAQFIIMGTHSQPELPVTLSGCWERTVQGYCARLNARSSQSMPGIITTDWGSSPFSVEPGTSK